LIFQPSSVAANSSLLLLHFESMLICSWPAKMFFLTVGLNVSAFQPLIFDYSPFPVQCQRHRFTEFHTS
jgi:hypothetical protein